MNKPNFYKSIISISIFIAINQNIHAQTEADTTSPAISPQLPTLSSQAGNTNNSYVATRADAVLRSKASLFETSQSISVITQQQLEQRQANTVAEALNGVAGVTSGQYGRRGWDDFIIRGQISSAQTFIDGLRVQASDNVLRAEDLTGLESIQVVKGPTSVGFGLALPGGLVNLNTKRPQAESFYKAGLSVGSYGLRQGTFDLNYAPNANEKGALRVVGRLSSQDDYTDDIYFKNQYLATSYNFDLNEKNTLSIIGSYLNRDYVRQQGIPYSKGSYKDYSHRLYFGHPDYGYDVSVFRIGTNFEHILSEELKFKQNFAMTRTHTQGNPIFVSGNNLLPIIKRAINHQDKQDINYTLDQYFQMQHQAVNFENDLIVGLDAMHERSDYYRRNDTINDFNVNAPSNEIIVRRLGIPSQQLTYTQYTGLYVKNTLKFDQNWILGLSGRHDWTQVENKDVLTAKTIKNSDQAFTSSASLMYQMNKNVAPYISYSTSFMPVSDMGQYGNLLNPEQGKQTEAGVKFQTLDERLQGYVAYYDLTRKNVTESDASGLFSIQTGKQLTRGFETEISTSFTPHLNISGSYSYIPTAKVTESTLVADIGKRANHVPKHSSALSSQYFLNPDHFGWNVGTRLQFQGERSAQRGQDHIPIASYTVFDVNVGYIAKRWDAGLTIKNILNKTYIAGTTPNAQLVNWGEPVNLRLNLNLKF